MCVCLLSCVGCTLGHALKLGSKLPSPFFFFFCCGSVVLVDFLGMFSQRSNAPSLCLSADSPPGFGTPPLLHSLPTNMAAGKPVAAVLPDRPSQLSRPCLPGSFVSSAGPGFSPGCRRLSHVHGDLLHNGDAVATFPGSPPTLDLIFQVRTFTPNRINQRPPHPPNLVPSDTGSCRTLRSSGARGNGALPDGYLHWLSVSSLKAPRAGLSSVYASFPSCVSTHDPV